MDMEINSNFDDCLDALYDRELAQEVASVFSAYNYFELCRATFCINAWRYNRAHLSFYLSLNYALLICEKGGQKNIDCYSDFVEFFNTLKPYFNSQFEDEITPDFGDIKISFNGNFYPVFLGNGYNFVFPMMQSLYALSKSLNIVKSIEEVLIYVKDMVEYLSDTNIYDSDKDLSVLYLPTERFFESCKLWYELKDIREISFLKTLISSERNPIEETHFICENGKLYPLFNPSIIVDAFHILCKDLKLTKEQTMDAARFVLYETIRNNFELDPDSNKLLIHIGIIEDLDKLKIVGQLLFDFALLGNNKILFFINEDTLEKKDINKVIKATNSLVQSNQLKVVEFMGNGKCRVGDFSFCKEVGFIVYDSEIRLTNVIKFAERGQILSYYFYDLITILNRAKSADDICDFLKFKNESKAQFFCQSGNAAIFETWSTQHKELMQGAIDASLVTTDVYLVEWNVFKEYLDLNKWYPFFNYTELFANPCRWIFDKEYDRDYIALVNKAVIGYGGFFRKIDNSYLFLVFNFTFENLNEKATYRHEAIRMIEDLNFRNFVLFEEILKDSGLYEFDGVHIMYMPMQYAQTVDNTGFLKQHRKYVYSDCYFQDGRILIRYAVEEELLMNDILESADKRVECEYFLELLSCLNGKFGLDFDYIKNKVNERRNDKKDIDALQIELKYYYSLNNTGLVIDDEYYVKVRKSIANDCKNANIESGLYSAKEATEIIRKLQDLLIPHFENVISKFNKYNLHKYLLSILAFNIHNKNINMKRYSVINKDSISDEAKDITSKNIIVGRERNKDNIRELTYLIETNLAIKHTEDKNITIDDLKYLIAYSRWLVVLQDNADNAHYNLFETKIHIEDDFLVSTVVSEEQNDLSKKRHKRVYENEDYRPVLQDDVERAQQADKFFYEDTGVELDKVLLLCSYFSHEFSFTFKNEEISDVFELSENEIKADIRSWLVNFTEIEFESTFQALDYLIIDESKIKAVNDKEEQFVPLWQREGRNYRFDVRPLVRINDKIIFSPVVMYELKIMWESGIFQFFLPYEYGLDRLRKFIMHWKSECEKRMELEIESLFKDMGCITRRNVQLHKLDKKYGHPSNLGDYDVIAVDTSNKIVWNLESKFLNKVGSLREYFNHQDSFFVSNKKDEKFLRRITYLDSHLVSILNALGINDSDRFQVKNYMVTNKVFYADIKKVDFDIITFYELKKLLADS